MKKTLFTQIEGGKGFYALLATLAAVILIGMFAVYQMEHNGHWITGMNNQIVWGMPHIFAIFLIVAASGALNVASIGSVFSKKIYKPLAPLSALLAIALLIGGLAILVLDLGRPDRLIIAMTYYNFKSIFAWNIILYNGFIALVAVYLWTMMEKRMNRYTTIAGYAAFIWRLILTTGTGSIFGFLVAREGYDAAIMAPMFILMSFSFGLAFFMLVLMKTYKWTGRPLGDVILRRLKNLLAIFVAGVLYFVVTMYITNLYATEHHGVVSFILRDGGIYPILMWGGYLLLGTLIPLALLFHPATAMCRKAMTAASWLVILGGFSLLYVIIIGGQAYPLNLFPGYEVISSFEGDVGSGFYAYTPTLNEILLGFAGIAIALAMTAVAVNALRFLPESLADEEVDPHAKG
ncbi:MAG: polysulfide reductase NrfD [Chromatiales bacterium]|nr:polysulfide reductase NrfD [Gammaproteobacteria bacterium]MBW6476858.1 polysulfide reductase NrfD [Chromatiales bacterium]